MRYFLVLTFIIFIQLSNLMAIYDSDRIIKEINSYLNSKVEGLTHKINEKVKIPKCFGTIKIKEKYESLKTLEISCIGEKPWKYNLRTNISEKINKKKHKIKINKKKIGVLTSSKNLKRGDTLKKEDIQKKYLSHIGSSNTFTASYKIIGRKLKVPLKEGQIIRERHLIKNWLIKEGQKVKIEHKVKGLLIVVDGIALKSGMKGDYLEVKNENSGKIIKGWVKNNKKITIFR